jgi:hypothetical protein
VGKERLSHSTQGADPSGEKGGSCHAVHIVVAVDQDGLFSIDGKEDPSHGRREISKGFRGMEPCAGGPQVSFRVLGITKAPGGQEGAEGPGEIQSLL